jgi:hypothetical protein
MAAVGPKVPTDRCPVNASCPPDVRRYASSHAASRPHSRAESRSGMRRQAQLFEVNPLACPTCYGAMRLVAFITQASVIDQILTHLRTRDDATTRRRGDPGAWAAIPTTRQISSCWQCPPTGTAGRAVHSTDPDRNSDPEIPSRNVTLA